MAPFFSTAEESQNFSVPVTPEAESLCGIPQQLQGPLPTRQQDQDYGGDGAPVQPCHSPQDWHRGPSRASPCEFPGLDWHFLPNVVPTFPRIPLLPLPTLRGAVDLRPLSPGPPMSHSMHKASCVHTPKVWFACTLHFRSGDPGVTRQRAQGKRPRSRC